jgi:hypothetical protein
MGFFMYYAIQPRTKIKGAQTAIDFDILPGLTLLNLVIWFVEENKVLEKYLQFTAYVFSRVHSIPSDRPCNRMAMFN